MRNCSCSDKGLLVTRADFLADEKLPIDHFTDFKICCDLEAVSPKIYGISRGISTEGQFMLQVALVFRAGWANATIARDRECEKGND